LFEDVATSALKALIYLFWLIIIYAIVAEQSGQKQALRTFVDYRMVNYFTHLGQRAPPEQQLRVTSGDYVIPLVTYTETVIVSAALPP